MADIVKINTVSSANIVKLNGIARANFSKVLGQSKAAAAASFADTKSLTFDGVGDYAYASLPSNWGKETGTYSFWLNLDISDDVSKYLLSFTTGDGSFNDFVIFMYFKVTTGKYVFIARQRRTVSSTQHNFVTVAQQSSTYHGRPFQRTSGSFSSIQQNYNSIRTGHGSWHQVTVTWDVDDSYTYSSTGYEGNQKIYINGALVGFGTSTLPGHNGIGTNNEMDMARTANLSTVYLAGLSPSHGMANMYMNDVAIWTSALDANNAAAIYNSGDPIDLTSASGNYNQQGNLVGYWKMEDDLTDSSSNSNSLTVAGNTTFVSAVPS